MGFYIVKITDVNKPLIKNDDIFFFSFIFIFIAFFALKIGVSTNPDDISYLKALNHSGYYDYFKHRYNTWSGRVAVEFIAVSIIPHLYLLKLFMASCYMLLSYSLWKITLSEKVRYQYGIPVVITLTLLVTPSVSTEAVYWAAGAFNYLVPMSLGMFSVCVLLDQDAFGAKTKIMSLIALAVSANSEQCAIILLVVSVLNFVFNTERRFTLHSALYYFVTASFSLLLFLSPGAHQRFYIESGKFMPNFDDFSIFQKASFGIDRYVVNVFDKSEFLFILASILTLIITMKKTGYIYHAMRATFAAFISFKYVLANQYISQPLSPENWLSTLKYLSYGAVIVHACLIVICILESEINLAIKRNCVFSIIMGAAVTVAIGLSPTVYASGERILYFSEMLMILFICSLIPELKKI
jgi:hypothetical protein